MEWIEGAIVLAAALACYLVAFRSGHNSAIEKATQVMFRHEAGRAEDRAALLHTVSRELGNSLMWENPDGL